MTLSIDEAVLEEAKVGMVRRGESMSAAVEGFLKSLTGYELEEMMDKLGIKKRYLSSEDVVKARRRPPKGMSAEKVIRAMRDARAKSVSGQ